MFSSLEALDSIKHRSLRLKPQGFGFAATAMTVPLSGSEFIEAAKFYPIVFPLDSCAPQALLSLKDGVNLFVGADGLWTVPYIPAHLRRYPFILNRVQDNGQATVLIAAAAASLNETTGERLFDDTGAQTPRLTQIISFLSQFQAEIELTTATLAALEPILVERQIDIDSPGQPKQSMTGLRAVDPDKFAALPDETFLEWRRNGLLPLVYAHLASMTNVQRLAELQVKGG